MKIDREDGKAVKRGLEIEGDVLFEIGRGQLYLKTLEIIRIFVLNPDL